MPVLRYGVGHWDVDVWGPVTTSAPPTTTFASVAEALAADIKATRLRVWLDGVPIDCWEAHAEHGVMQPIGTCSLVLPAPLPADIFNKSVVVQAGYPGAVRTIFNGRTPSHGADIDESGKVGRINAVGWASLLDYQDRADLKFAGPISLRRIFNALCKRRGVPHYRSEEILTVFGADIRLGGVSEIDDGYLIIDRTTSPLSWLNQKAQLFGYYIFDTPEGRVVQKRVSGLPTTDAVATYEEGVNCYRVGVRSDSRPMVTYWEVFGAKFTKTDGRRVAIRSIPEEVPFSAELDPPGYRRDAKRDPVITSVSLADSVRRVLEVDRSAPAETTTWEADGAPDRQPGDAVQVESATCSVSGLRWLMSIQQSVTDRDGYYATMEGWQGAGEILPSGDDCISTAISSTTYHLGAETIDWYDDPSPDGTDVTLSFTIPDEYSSLTVYAEAHGCNSFYAGAIDDEDSSSRFEIWQRPEPSEPSSADNQFRKVGDGILPIMEEIAGVVHWQEIHIPIDGSVKAGAARLVLISGFDASVGDYDDYEVRELRLVTCGVGEPDLPGEV